jgi:NADH dehydrogenase (ubiquinone) 1 alpha subcomplex subunit 5
VEALTKHRLAIVEAAKENEVSKVEHAIGQGQIEEVIVAAKNELSLVGKMIEWKACVSRFSSVQQRLHSLMLLAFFPHNRWEPLEVKPGPGQWNYFT